ncbi:uncharacterized protein LOC131682212 [Topomyia yanbarensis]|uniref:uncharacterized protein LOC131682212 n=1 Tax=Topomyia yanbarensis TaxID=2498891 RepID=UPI00273BA3E0|nr:uncharacterized protein LOC131682212 [Topomyia yanbarensis]
MAQFYVILTVAALCTSFAQAGFLDWFRSSANKGHSICKVDFEVLDPKGLRLWTVHKPETKMFGVELFINPTGKSDQTTCNLCKNTTEVMHGKFFIQDDNVIVKKGDVLEFVVITDNGKTVQRHKRRKLVVNDYIIKPEGRCACPAPVQHSAVREADPAGEIELLERIISNLSNRCAEGVVSNYLFLQVGTPAGPSDLVQRVKTYFTSNTLLKPYAEAVISAEEYADGIGFQMKSVIDKLKVLQLGNAAGDILDYDGFTTVDKIDIRVSE